MGVTRLIKPSTGRALVYSGGLALLWVVAAAVRPTTTYHLAPLLVAAVMPVALWFEDAHTPGRALVGPGIIGGVLALVTTGLLAIADWLRGPSLLPFGGAATESIVFAFVGAVGGIVASIALRARS